jgi:hypothetical protein
MLKTWETFERHERTPPTTLEQGFRELLQAACQMLKAKASTSVQEVTGKLPLTGTKS